MYTRDIENDILELLEYFPVLVILGARQVGKTTLAKSLAKKIKKKCVLIDFENPADEGRISEPLSFFENQKDACVILDEVQRKPEIFPILRSVVDAHRVPCRFILLGSASPELLIESSESLAGRVVYTELSPLSFWEIKNDADCKEHWFKGGFPEPFQIKSDKIRNQWYSSFVQTYIEREFGILGLKTSPAKLRHFLSMAALTSGNLVNQTQFSNSLDLSVPTISKYISFMEKAFIIRLLKPLTINLKKRLVKSPKIYIRDSGILHSLLRIEGFDSLLGHPNVGNSWEGYVIEQILNAVAKDYEPFFYRTQDGTECDLVLTKNLKPEICIEAKFSAAPKKTKSLTTTIQDLKTQKNYIVIPNCSEPYPLDKNITVCSLENIFEEIGNRKK